MSEWLEYRERFLDAILRREAPPQAMDCAECSQAMSWRCHDCFGEPVFCTCCLVETHQRVPFHRVSKWDGNTFYRSSLSEAGVVLSIGHGGRRCPYYVSPNATTFSESQALRVGVEANTTSSLLDTLTSWEEAGINLETLKSTQAVDSDGNPWLTVIDSTGIHQIQAQYCRCQQSSHVPEYQQLLELGLYPASITQPRTTFTFRVLDDYDLLNLETKATPQRYLAKLQRLTTNLFPDALPDRYRELLRVIRQWRNLKQWKNAGMGYSTTSSEILPGGLALFCPACPQPGINLPDDWKDDPNPYDTLVCMMKPTHLGHY